ncbi:hypothetical protein [Halalkalicoccus tibetensis]|uniref:Uncharacterized protein n=1 Tax=Halalkalicoccus tibetensis TaxID=175632 RepID=A0ABD5V944_9EURY
MSVEGASGNKGGRYRYTEYRQGSGTIAVIQDVESDRAWIQSTVSVPADP